MTRGLMAMVVVTGLAALAAPAQAAPDFCGPSERPCTRITVPLDRSGAVPGGISLQVERSQVRRPTRPPLLLLAGGPGQSGTAVFSPDAVSELLGAEGRRRDVVVLDQRGTGLSSSIVCPALQRSPFAGPGDGLEACESALGVRKAHYQTRDSVEDIEAVRRELGVPKLALMGTSYGTKVALAYAIAHPDRVDRLVLDSVVTPDGPSPFGLETLQATPRLLATLCGRRCRSFTRDPVADLRALSGRLARAPLRGVMVDDKGRKRKARMRQQDLLVLLAAGDFNPVLRDQLPGAVRAALDGDQTPLLRLASTGVQQEVSLNSTRNFSLGLYAATVCEEVGFPWGPATPVAARLAAARAQVAKAPARAFRAFARSAAVAYDYVELCSRWRGSGRPRAAASPARLPSVPTLVLAGARDARTPVASARSVARRIPGAQLLVATRSGHDVIGQDQDGCAARALRNFLGGRRAARRCSAGTAARVSAPPPRSISRVRRLPGVPGRTAPAVRYTLARAGEELAGQFLLVLATALSGKEPPTEIAVGGLRGGRASLSLRTGRLNLEGLIAVPGVRISGSLRDPLENPRGRLRISGSAAAKGTLTIRGGFARGRLGGRRVRFKADAGLGDAFDKLIERALGARAAKLGAQ